MLLVKFPSKSRPDLFASTFRLWNAQPPLVRFIVSLDADDSALPKYLKFLETQPNAEYFVGKSANKVDAINRDMEHAGEFSVAALASDDMLPQRPDYAARIMGLMAEHYPDGDGVLHLNDGRTGRKLNSLCVCGRRYFDRFGHWYRPLSMGGYASVYCDEEWQKVSEGLGRATYIDEVLIAHKWTDVTGQDDLHKRNEEPAQYRRDGQTYEARKAAGFP